MTMRAALAIAPLALLAACGGEGQLGPEAMAVGEAPEMPEQASDPVIETITTEDLAIMIESGHVTLIDVRTDEEVAEGIIPGAQHMPLDSFDPAQIEQSPYMRVVLYCRSGRRSEEAAQMLMDFTGENASHLEGGIIAWEDAGGKLVVPAES